MSIADKLAQISKNEQRVYNAGYEKGKSEGGNTEEAYEQGVTDGKKSEYDAFWDAVQENGNKTDYYFGFAGRAWQNNFRPKYSIRPINPPYMLAYWNKGTLDLVELCSELGIEIDFSRSTNVMNLFSSNTVLTRVGTIDTRKAPNINATFQYCSALHTIEKLILKDDGTTAFNIETFRNCSALINLTIEGVIGQANYNMQWSTKLSADSIDSIIYALSATTSGLAVTFSKAAVDAACKVREGSHYYDSTNSLWWATLLATKSNWTISLV